MILFSGSQQAFSSNLMNVTNSKWHVFVNWKFDPNYFFAQWWTKAIHADHITDAVIDWAKKHIAISLYGNQILTMGLTNNVNVDATVKKLSIQQIQESFILYVFIEIMVDAECSKRCTKPKQMNTMCHNYLRTNGIPVI